MSPEDPRAEVHRLREVVDDKEKKIHNLTMQLKTFEDVASGNIDLGEEVVELKAKLQSYEVLHMGHAGVCI